MRSPTSSRSVPARLSRRALLASASLLTLPRIAMAAEEPRYGGVFVVGTAVEPRHLNLNIATDVAIKLIANPIYNKLVDMKRDLSPSPDLATAWTVSDDARVYTFTLADGVLWHDGTKLTSADVVFTFQNVLFAYHNIGKLVAPSVESVSAPDPATVVFTLKHPSDIFMTFVSGQGYIQPQHLYEGHDIMTAPANLHPVGTGPFRFAAWSRGQQIVLERNPNYFRKAQPYVDRIITRFIPDSSARVMALQAGEVDYLAYSDLPASAIHDLQQDKAITVASAGHEAWGSIVELNLNLDKAPYSDVRVRRALSQAVDRRVVVDKATFGLTRVATGPVNSDIAWAYDPSLHQYVYDPSAANDLLDEAGLARDANGTRFKATISVERSFEAAMKAAQIIAEQFKAVGVAAEVRPMDVAAINELVYVKRGFDMNIQTLTTGPDPAMGMERQYVSTNIRPIPYTNAIGYRNPKVDTLFQQAANSADRSERARLYKEISAILVDDAAMVWLYQNTPYSAFRSEFGNLHNRFAESIYNYGDVYWKGGSATRS